MELKISSSGAKIELYLDRLDGFMDLDTCAEISRFLEFHLDHESALPSHYVLEVSSPGMTNSFRVLEQYHKHQGSVVDVVLLDGRKVRGVLQESDSEHVFVAEVLPVKASKNKNKAKSKKLEPELSGERHQLSFAEIKSTKRVFDF